MKGMKKAAANFQTKALGSRELGMVIFHQKAVAKSLSRMAQDKAEASDAMAAWAKHEGEAMEQFFDHQNQLDSMYNNLVEDLVKMHHYNGTLFREIIKAEKSTEDFIEKKKECEARLSKAYKQLESAKKAHKGAAEEELGKAKTSLSKCEVELVACQGKVSLLKWQVLSEMFSNQTAMRLKFHSDAQHIIVAQEQMSDIYLRGNLTNSNQQELYKAAIAGQTVLNDLTETLNRSKISFLKSKASFKGSCTVDRKWSGPSNEGFHYSEYHQRSCSSLPDRIETRPLPEPPTKTPIISEGFTSFLSQGEMNNIYESCFTKSNEGATANPQPEKEQAHTYQAMLKSQESFIRDLLKDPMVDPSILKRERQRKSRSAPNILEVSIPYSPSTSTDLLEDESHKERNKDKRKVVTSSLERMPWSAAKDDSSDSD